MKKLMKSLMLVAVAAMGLTACQNDIMDEVNINTNETVTLTFVADAETDTRTSVSFDKDGDKTISVFNWTEGDVIGVVRYAEYAAGDGYDAGTATNKKNSENAIIDGTTATFNVEMEPVKVKVGEDTVNVTEFTDEKYAAVFPGSAVFSNTAFDNIGTQIKNTQTKPAGLASYDPTADLMVSKVVDAEPNTETQLQFTRLAAIGEMKIKDIKTTENFVSAKLTLEGAKLTGKSYVNLDTHEITLDETSDYVQVNATDVTYTDGIATIYFTCYPVEFSGNYTLVVETDGGTYTNTGRSINAEKPLCFTAGNVTSFTISAGEYEAKEGVWNLVTDASTLAERDMIFIAAKGYDFAMSTTQNNNNRAQTAITKNDNTAVPTSDVQILTLVNGTDADTFGLYTGDGYLYAASSGSNHLKTETTLSANSSWTISITDGVATVKAQGTNTRNWMRYNSTNNPPIFSCYASDSNQADICIYKLEGGQGTIPTIPISITAENITIEKEESNAKTDAGVIFENIGDWTISVSDDADWLTVEYSGGAINYFAQENTTTYSRVANVTITATLDGEDDITETFTITQKGQPAPIQAVTISEFIAKEADNDIYYQLTGRVISIASTTYGNITIKDADSQIDVRGLTTTQQTSGNDKSFSELGINVGDQVTLCAIRGDYNGTAQAGSNDLPAYYVSHEVDTTPEFLSLNTDNITFVAAGGNETVTANVLGEGTLTYSNDADWLTVAINNNIATLTATENTLTEERTTTVTLTFGGVSKTVAVKQNAKGGGEVILSEEFDNNNTNIDGSAITASTFPNFSGSFSKAYKGCGGIKLGTGKAIGYITSKALDLSKAFTVQLDAGKYKSNNTEITITVGSQTKTIKTADLSSFSQSTDKLTTFVFEFEAATASSTIKISTTNNGKRAIIDNVVVSYK